MPPPVEEMLRDKVDEEPQPGCSCSAEFREVKAVLPTTDDDLIEVDTCTAFIAATHPPSFPTILLFAAVFEALQQ